MAASAHAPRTPAAPAFRPVPLRHRLYGFGSIYGKTIRDSRLAFIIAAGLFGGLALVMGTTLATVFPTVEARRSVDALVGAMPPAMVNLFGNATLMGEKLGTLGGYMTWKYGAMFALGTALWSILALSSTLAGEAARGSLDLVAAAPFGKRRIALEKLAAHLTMLWAAMAVVAVATTVSSNAFGQAELGDRIPLVAAAGFALWIGAIAMCFGGLTLALAPLLGRGGAAGVGGGAMVLLWAASGLDLGGPLVALSPFHWTVTHIPLIERYDWPGVAATALVGLVLYALGIELFARRDLGVTAGLRIPGLPKPLLGVRGPVARAFGDQLPRAAWWGIGMAVWGALLSSLVGSFSELIGRDSTLIATFERLFPGYDFGTAGGWLQLYAEMFFIAAGFAATTFVSKWAADEKDGRLDEVLSAPLSRARWVIAGGLGAFGSVVVMTALWIAGVALGATGAGGTAGDAIVGSLSLGLYAAAIVGIGVAIGGLWRTSIAAELAALVVVATFLLDLLAPPLNLPDWLHQLALTAHFGQPMIGRWDAAGVVACLVIAIGGVLVGAAGMARRDVTR